MDISRLKVIVFDTFGTVVDWHSTIVEEGEQLGRKYGIQINWHNFANDWRLGYFRDTKAIARHERKYEKIDLVFAKILDELIEKYGLQDRLPEEEKKEFAQVWHRLRPWDDVIEGLERIGKKYAVGPFTNGDFRLMLDMEKNAGLPWDFIITADIFQKFKPDPAVYVDAVNFLDAVPGEVMKVAAHPTDLDGAKKAGCLTVYVPREKEFGEGSSLREADGETTPDAVVEDFGALAELLGA